MASKSNDDSSLSHTRWNCKYHLSLSRSWQYQVLLDNRLSQHKQNKLIELFMADVTTRT